MPALQANSAVASATPVGLRQQQRWIEFGEYEVQTWYYSPYPDVSHPTPSPSLLLPPAWPTVDVHPSSLPLLAHAGPAPGRQELTKHSKAFLCEHCLEAYETRSMADSHALKCILHHPPGTEVYRKGGVSLWEVDGMAEPHYCRNLCLLAKLFLETKTLYEQVEPFLFYILTGEREPDLCIAVCNLHPIPECDYPTRLS